MIENPFDFTSLPDPPRKILTPGEMWNIDTKLDDGKPGQGKIMGPKKGNGWAPDCTTNTDAALADYNLSLSSRECYLIMFPGF